MNHYLVKERERLELQQKQVYDSIGVGKSTYYRWESGNPIPSDKLADLARLGFDVNYVVTGQRLSKSEDSVTCFTQDNLKKAISSFIYNTAELGLLTKAPNTNVSSLVDMAVYSLYKEIGQDYLPVKVAETDLKAK
ncbi:helix-turn-helix transcriptional regulator [Pseudoalteromonas sp. MMG013]|uniref:helix-turn-helix domain-containing protein n=1 Tax=unclassified Pseudoalteromonas TaxID=194690 RepID=UPI001B37D7C0|nr:MULTISPECIES: helix-turn-helix transcriptional regulator [unclassified Pseudoalteromonas]MBQ4852964.1 helix-turn-helix transcriptional regulator [Pseudoalteromonas sp. MMG012]MBQ4860492.1 helix-turn-helix transcriptional regulator [Pseudoalteromonas sp. MMG013]